MKNFTKNLNKNTFLNTEVSDSLNVTPKPIYLFNDLKELNVDFSEKLILKQPLGQRIEYLNKNYPFIVNPYETNVDSFISDDIAKYYRKQQTFNELWRSIK